MLDKLQEELKTAMKAGEKATMTGLRNIIGKLKAKQIDKGENLTADDSLKTIKSAAKQLKESIRQYKTGGRDDLAERESFELSLLERFLPEEMSADEIRKTVRGAIQSTEAGGMQDMGKVMGMVMQDLSGSVDGKLVQNIVKEELSQ